MAEIPSYAWLRTRADAPAGSAWRVFGSDDQLGTLNHLTPQRVLDATRSVRSGRVINLDLPLTAFDPPLIPTRGAVRHHMFANNPHHRDEYLDGFYPQAASQVDGLRHIGHPDHGFYNGTDPAAFEAGTHALGIHHFAEHGIVGRGVLVDVARYLESVGRPVDHDTNQAIPIDVVAAAATAQGVELRPGDILMLRLGWLHHHLTVRDDAQRATAVQSLRCPGLAQSHATAEWLWDNQFALVAADNVALETWPPPEGSPFVTESERTGRTPRGPHTGLLHRILIPLLGLAIGELWALDELADACAADGVYDCLVVVKPLNLPGGAGSPANATAIR